MVIGIITDHPQVPYCCLTLERPGRPVAPGAGLPKTRRRDIDDLGVYLLDLFVIHPHLFHHPRDVVLHKDVAFLSQP